MSERMIQPRNPTRPTRPSLSRWLLTGVAALLFGLGWLGLFVPGLPTTIFWLGAVLAAGKACPVIERWVYARPGVGPIVRDLAEHGMMSRANKRRALLGMSAAVLLSATLLALSHLWIAAAAVLLAGLAGAGCITHLIRTAEPSSA
jgi:uncharacterized membrane protein YbaN (DUF454 family)